MRICLNARSAVAFSLSAVCASIQLGACNVCVIKIVILLLEVFLLQYQLNLLLTVLF